MAQKQPEWWQVGGRPPLPTVDQGQAIVNAIAQTQAIITEMMQPVYDAADGIRAELTKRGYSETAAEHAAMQHITLSQHSLWGGASA